MAFQLFDIGGLSTVHMLATRLNNKVEIFYSRLQINVPCQGTLSKRIGPRIVRIVCSSLPLFLALHKLIWEEVQ